MRILPSQSSGMKPNVGSAVITHDVQIDAVAFGDRMPESDAGATKGVDADPQPCALNDLHVDDGPEVPRVRPTKS